MLERVSERLVNPPGGDPCLLVELRGLGTHVLFDIGDNRLSTGDLLRVSHLFVSHAHVDHWIGFDRLLRAFLGKDAVVTVFGPPGITRHLRAKLDAYTWNLWFEQDLVFIAEEADGNLVRSTAFSVKRRFREAWSGMVREHGGIARRGQGWRVEFVVLDHAVECLGYALVEDDRYTYDPAALAAAGVEPGPHLARWKDWILAGEVDREVQVAGRIVRLRDLAGRIGHFTSGRRIAYITDTAFTPATVEGVLRLARGADVLYCEATFPEADRDKAEAARHLTAAQAGALARAAGARRLVPFHFSRRYARDPAVLLEEAERGLRGELYARLDVAAGRPP